MSASAVPALTNATRVMRDDQLTARHRLMIEYMVHGVHHASLTTRTQVVASYDPATGDPILRAPRVGEPLDLIAAAAVVRVTRRAARNLSRQPAFQRALAAETQAFRDGARARATHRMVALIDEPGQGKAADRKVQLAASMATIGEVGGGTSVTINNTIAHTLTAGVVIDLTEDDRDDRASAIEHVAA